MALNWRHILTDDLEDGNPYEHCDFCPVAVSPLLEKNQGMKEEPADPEPAAEPAAADKKKPGRKLIDKGTVGALWDAHWSIKDIAEEVKCSEDRVKQILHELRRINKEETK